jgi:hypothetical protein
MRARWLKPEFFTDKKIATLDPSTALVYQALWCWADDGGVCQCDPDWLKAQVFFRWDFYTVDVISAALRTLYDLKVILVYRAGDDYFAEIRHWKRHQSVHKPAKFRHPRPDEQLTLSTPVDAPFIAGAPPAPVPGSPPPRHLDSYNPRSLDGDGPKALDPGDDPHSPGTSAHTTAPEDQFRKGKTPGELSLARELPTDADRLNLTALCATVPSAFTWVAECAGRLSGINTPGGKAMTPTQVAAAIGEFVGSGRHLESPPSFRLFKAFLDKAQNGSEAPRGEQGLKGRTDGAQSGFAASTGEAGAILVRIKGLKQRADVPGQSSVEFIRRADVEALGVDVLSAYDAIGGADRVLKTEPSKWGFVVREFADGLTYWRQNNQGGA